MATSFEIYRATAANAQAQFVLDVAAAEARRQATMTALLQSAQFASPDRSNGLRLGFPMGDDSTDTFPAFAAAVAAAEAQKAADLLAAEGRRQGVVGVAKDLLMSQTGPDDPF
jgi:hypothetical protein